VAVGVGVGVGVPVKAAGAVVLYGMSRRRKTEMYDNNA